MGIKRDQWNFKLWSCRRLLQAYLSLTVMSTGCLHFQDRPISSERAIAEFLSRTLENPGLRDYLAGSRKIDEWPPQVWDLSMLTGAALYFHPDLDVARAGQQLAQARLISAAERPNPSIAVSPGRNTHSTGGISPWLLTTDIDIPIETAGKRKFRIRRAACEAEAARWHVASEAWDIRKRVRSALVALYAAIRSETQLTEQKRLQMGLVEVLRSQVIFGAVNPLELNSGRINLDSTLLALADARRDKAASTIELATAIGLPASALESVKISFEWIQGSRPPPMTNAEYHSQVALRPDILSTLFEYAASQATLQLAIAGQFPDINLGSGYEFDQGDNKWLLHLSTTLPIFNHNRGAVAEAEALRSEQAARFRAVQARVLGDTDRAVAQYHHALEIEKISVYFEAKLIARGQRARSMFDIGEIDKSMLISVWLEVNSGKRAVLEARIETWRALNALEDALRNSGDVIYPLWATAAHNEIINGESIND